MIKAVIFDYGNVVSCPQDTRCYDKMADRSGVSADIFRSYFLTFRNDYDRGTINGAEMYRRVLEAAGYPELATDAELCEDISMLDLQSWINVNSEVISWSRELKREGYLIGVLSNMPHDFLTYYKSSVPIFTEADETVFSCHVNLIKPEPAIYQVILDKLGIKPAEAVFFDDVQRNIDAANNYGLHGFVWTGLDMARQDFDRLIKMEK